MRSRASLLVLFLAISSLALPHFTHAGGIPYFGPIVPENINQCAAGWSALIVVINNIISFLITIAIVFVAPIMIAYAGFLYVVNPLDPGGINKAKGILTNTILGIVVALSAWMIVDAVMAVLTPNGQPFMQNWASLVTWSGDPCLISAGALQTLNQASPNSGALVTGVTASGNGAYVNGSSAALCNTSACTPAFLQSVGFNSTQANVMSCIALTENGGNATGCNGNACGTFQIMLTVNNLVGPDCGGTLYCPSLCKGNNGAAVQTAACQPCVQAANNPKCNAETAQYLVSRSGYADWTPPRSDNQKSAACVQQYSGS